MTVSGKVGYSLAGLKRAGLAGGGTHLVLRADGDPSRAPAAYLEASLGGRRPAP